MGQRPLVIAIAGGTASGKTTVARRVVEGLRAAADAELEGKAAAPQAASVREEDFAAGEGEERKGRRAPARKPAAGKAEATPAKPVEAEVEATPAPPAEAAAPAAE
jgi:small subunit ribosomal protein S2